MAIGLFKHSMGREATNTMKRPTPAARNKRVTSASIAWIALVSSIPASSAFSPVAPFASLSPITPIAPTIPFAPLWPSAKEARRLPTDLFSDIRKNGKSESSDGRDELSDVTNGDHSSTTQATPSRRSVLRQSLVAATAAVTSTHTLGGAPNLSSNVATVGGVANVANAAVGTLPEFQDTNAILQGLTIEVTDQTQFDQTVEFFVNGFDGMKVLRERIPEGGGVVREAWLGFGPETPSIPPTFTLPISSPSQYGGHSSLHLRYNPLSPSLLYKPTPGPYNNEPAPGDSIAYLQLGVPQYRISQMVKYGGNVVDAYGWVNVVSPSGLPVRGVVGVAPDPIMFVAVNCVDVGRSEEFYNRLGFVRQEFPYARPNKGQGQFEPPQPPKSVYLAPSPNSMGVLLLQNKNKKKGITPNPVVKSLNVVYNPSSGEGVESGSGSAGSASSASSAPPNLDPQAVDPSLVPISFIPVDYLEREIKATAPPFAAGV